MSVKIFGTAPLEKIDVIRDNKYIHARPGAGDTADFVYRDADVSPGEHYYYVRVQQTDRNVAWSSPIWVRMEK